jgi:hypothetical protein
LSLSITVDGAPARGHTNTVSSDVDGTTSIQDSYAHRLRILGRGEDILIFVQCTIRIVRNRY